MPGAEARALGRVLALYSLVGVLSGLIAVLFTFAVEWAGELLLLATAGIDPSARAWEDAGTDVLSLPTGARWWVLIVPALGGLASGLLCARFAPEALGPGTAGVIDAYHRRGGLVRRRVPLVKSIASALTIGSGGSAGVEGPIGYVTAGMASVLGGFFKVSPSERRVLLMAGFAAGIGAVFHAPMAASIFAAEVLYRELDIEHEVLVPAILASTMAFGVYGAALGWEPIWLVPPVALSGAAELIPYLFLAVFVAGAGALYVNLNHAVRRRIGQASALPLWARPAIGGLMVGAIGLFVPQAVGTGYGIGQLAIDGSVGIGALLLLAGAKMATSALTASSGGSGGLFAPSLVIGAALGGTVAAATNLLDAHLGTGLHVRPAAFAVVGMAGFFANVVNAPLSTVIMVSELAGDYRLLVPTLWVCAIAWFFNRRLHLHEDQVRSRLEAPGHLADMMDAVLRRISVGDAIRPTRRQPVTVRPDTRLRELVQLFASTAQGVFPIVDADGAMHGVVDGRLLRRTVAEEGIDEVLIADDFHSPALTAHVEDSLYEAVTRMTASGYDEIVVVDSDGQQRVAGILSRREVVTAYHRRMLVTAPSPEVADDGSEPDQAPPAAEPVDLFSAIERGGVLVGLPVIGRDQALLEIVRVAQLPEGCDRAHLQNLLLEREDLSSTNIGDGVALPHPQTDGMEGLGQPRIVMALLRRAIPWGDPTAPPVQTVCMLLAPSGDTHLRLLGQLARALSDPALRQLLSSQAPPKAILARLRELAPPPG